jgi:hypothetical protein
VSLLRIVAQGACWYLLSVTLVGIGSRRIGSRPLMRAAERLTLPALRDIVGWTVGVGILTTTVVRPSPAVAVDAPPPTIIMTRSRGATTTTTTGTPSAPTVIETMRPPPVAATWVVRLGDCFWSIALDLTTLEFGREPSESEITAYWRVLIEANRGVLADATNPDLLFVQQVLRLPPVS